MTDSPMPGLRLRLLADTSDGKRVVRFDPLSGQRLLVNPAVSDLADPASWRHEPWPLAGVVIEGETPARWRPSTALVDRGVAEGWIARENEQVVHRPGGPPGRLWAVTHTFVHCDALVLKTLDGDVRYRVLRQPDKYVDEAPDSEQVTPEIYAAGTTRVDWFYDVELED